MGQPLLGSCHAKVSPTLSLTIMSRMTGTLGHQISLVALEPRRWDAARPLCKERAMTRRRSARCRHQRSCLGSRRRWSMMREVPDYCMRVAIMSTDILENILQRRGTMVRRDRGQRQGLSRPSVLENIIRFVSIPFLKYLAEPNSTFRHWRPEII